MDIQAIQDNIEELELGDTTIDNVQELSALYIVKEHLLQTVGKSKSDVVSSELDDILPSYRNYVSAKEQYQQKSVGEEVVIHSLELLCQEIREFLIALYGSTDFYKERKIIRSMMDAVSSKIQ